MTRLAQFVDISLDSEMIRKITERCVFKNMKKNKMSNYSLVPSEILDLNVSEFLRKGNRLLRAETFNSMINHIISPQYFCIIYHIFSFSGITGDWKNHLTVAEAEYFDEFYQKKMQDVKYTFVWD